LVVRRKPHRPGNLGGVPEVEREDGEISSNRHLVTRENGVGLVSSRAFFDIAIVFLVAY
jgi:hypothetical protein